MSNQGFPTLLPEVEQYGKFHQLHVFLVPEIAAYLTARVPDNYTVETETYVGIEDVEETMGIFPDVGVSAKGDQKEVAYVAEIEPTFTLAPAQQIERKLRFIKIQHTESGKLVTTIEVISPANKQAPGFKKYHKKQRALNKSGVQLVEIDLLRRGRRRFDDPRVSAADYISTVTRHPGSHVDVWTSAVGEPLPLIPVPLLPSVEAMPLPLNDLVTSCLERGGFERIIRARRFS